MRHGSFEFCIAFGIPETRSVPAGDILSFELPDRSLLQGQSNAG